MSTSQFDSSSTPGGTENNPRARRAPRSPAAPALQQSDSLLGWLTSVIQRMGDHHFFERVVHDPIVALDLSGSTPDRQMVKDPAPLGYHAVLRQLQAFSTFLSSIGTSNQLAIPVGAVFLLVDPANRLGKIAVPVSELRPSSGSCMLLLLSVIGTCIPASPKRRGRTNRRRDFPSLCLNFFGGRCHLPSGRCNQVHVCRTYVHAMRTWTPSARADCCISCLQQKEAGASLADVADSASSDAGSGGGGAFAFTVTPPPAIPCHLSSLFPLQLSVSKLAPSNFNVSVPRRELEAMRRVRPRDEDGAASCPPSCCAGGITVPPHNAFACMDDSAFDEDVYMPISDIVERVGRASGDSRNASFSVGFGDICMSHHLNICKYGRDCNHVHICRRVLIEAALATWTSRPVPRSVGASGARTGLIGDALSDDRSLSGRDSVDSKIDTGALCVLLGLMPRSLLDGMPSSLSVCPDDILADPDAPQVGVSWAGIAAAAGGRPRSGVGATGLAQCGTVGGLVVGSDGSTPLSLSALGAVGVSLRDVVKRIGSDGCASSGSGGAGCGRATLTTAVEPVGWLAASLWLLVPPAAWSALQDGNAASTLSRCAPCAGCDIVAVLDLFGTGGEVVCDDAGAGGRKRSGRRGRKSAASAAACRDARTLGVVTSLAGLQSLTAAGVLPPSASSDVVPPSCPARGSDGGSRGGATPPSRGRHGASSRASHAMPVPAAAGPFMPASRAMQRIASAVVEHVPADVFACVSGIVSAQRAGGGGGGAAGRFAIEGGPLTCDIVSGAAGSTSMSFVAACCPAAAALSGSLAAVLVAADSWAGSTVPKVSGGAGAPHRGHLPAFSTSSLSLFVVGVARLLGVSPRAFAVSVVDKAPSLPSNPSDRSSGSGVPPAADSAASSGAADGRVSLTDVLVRSVARLVEGTIHDAARVDQPSGGAPLFDLLPVSAFTSARSAPLAVAAGIAAVSLSIMLAVCGACTVPDGRVSATQATPAATVSVEGTPPQRLRSVVSSPSPGLSASVLLSMLPDHLSKSSSARSCAVVSEVAAEVAATCGATSFVVPPCRTSTSLSSCTDVTSQDPTPVGSDRGSFRGGLSGSAPPSPPGPTVLLVDDRGAPIPPPVPVDDPYHHLPPRRMEPPMQNRMPLQWPMMPNAMHGSDAYGGGGGHAYGSPSPQPRGPWDGQQQWGVRRVSAPGVQGGAHGGGGAMSRGPWMTPRRPASSPATPQVLSVDARPWGAPPRPSPTVLLGAAGTAPSTSGEPSPGETVWPVDESMIPPGAPPHDPLASAANRAPCGTFELPRQRLSVEREASSQQQHEDTSAGPTGVAQHMAADPESTEVADALHAVHTQSPQSWMACGNWPGETDVGANGGSPNDAIDRMLDSLLHGGPSPGGFLDASATDRPWLGGASIGCGGTESPITALPE